MRCDRDCRRCPPGRFDYFTTYRASTARAQANLMDLNRGPFPRAAPARRLAGARAAADRVEAAARTALVDRGGLVDRRREAVARAGRDESASVVEEVAEALGRGEANPKPRGAEAVGYWGSKSKLEDPEGQGFYARRR
jgi:hypothetical protein